ncbi:MAG: choice-of-anchor V domain-containing protein [Saprospiraceae bacterium]
MKKIFTPSSYRMIGLILGMVVWLANSFNPPNANTGAPFDGNCGNCHGGGNFNGTVALSGLPGTIQANTTYNLTLTMTPTGGNPNRGGFQLVAVDNNNANAGNLISVNAQTGTENSGGREYIEQRGTKTFGGNPISWDFDWTAPAAAAGNTIKFYFIGNFTNGNGGSSGDNAFDELNTFSFQPGASPVSASISSFENVSCNGGSDGSVTAQGAGGTPPYSYSWNNGQTTQTAVNLTAGTYSVTITDQAGSTGVASRTLTQPTAVNVLTSVAGVITCANPSASVSASATGGTSPYQYSWSNGDNGQSILVGMPGTYTVTVTDAKGCTKTGQATVNGNLLLPSAAASAPGPLTCATTSIILSGVGSSQGASFVYSWATSNGNIVSGGNTLSPVVNAVGTYTLTVINTSNGCSSTANTTVTSNYAQPTVNATADGKRTCADTVVALSATANPNSTFSWRNANNVVVGSGQSINVSTPGTYNVIATAQSNGCKDTATVSVQLDTLKPTASTTNGSITCLRSEDTLTVKSGPGVGYLWSGPGNFVSVNDSIVVDTQGLYIVTVTGTNGCTTKDTAIMALDTLHPALAVTNGKLSCLILTDELVAFSDSTLALYAWTGPNGFVQSSDSLVIYDTVSVNTAGLYFVTATSENGCTTVDTALVAQNAALTTQLVAKNNVTCFGGNNGSATVSVAGGLAPYSVTWSNNATGNTINNLPAGAYVWTATDAEGCTINGSVTITQPALLVANASATQETGNGANNGTATAQPIGGTTPYTYAWSNGPTTQTITGLPPATYAVTVKDANNCTAVQTVTVNPFNCSIAATVDVTNVTCFGGSDGAVVLNVNSAQGDTVLFFVNLLAGLYNFTYVDPAGCVVQESATVNQPGALSVAFDVTNVACKEDNNGAVLISAAGGNAPYVFSVVGPNGASAPFNLGIGVYQVLVVDANGCIANGAFEVVDLDNTPPVLACPPNISVCSGETVQYNLPTLSDNCNLNGITPTLTSGLASGSIFATTTTQVFSATDASDNTTTCAFTVFATQEPVIQTQNVVNDIGNQGAGSIDLSITGGTGTFSYAWSKDGAPFPGNTADLSNLFAGNYSVTVTDTESSCVVVFGPIVVDNIVGTVDGAAHFGIKLMPNPVDNELRIDWGTFQPLSASIYNNQGRLCGTFTAQALSQPVDVSALPAGWYVLHVQDETGQRVLLRFAKQSR